jgi:hypothetical protein
MKFLIGMIIAAAFLRVIAYFYSSIGKREPKSHYVICNRRGIRQGDGS